MSSVREPGAAEIYEFLADSLKMRWKRYRKRLKQCQRKFSEGAVHDSRIETRRLLSLIDMLRFFLPEAGLKKAHPILKRHLDTFDELRDTHVQLLFVGNMRGTFPAIRSFYKILLKRERRCARRTARDITHLRTARLARLVQALEKKLRVKSKATSRRSRGLDQVVRALNRPYDGVLRRWRLIDASDTATIHRTRIAFKKFRYMVEALAPLLPGVRDQQLEAMHEYQAMMGDIQDTEVLLSSLDKFLRKGKISADLGQRFRGELLRLRQWLIAVYCHDADRLREFWPLSRLAGHGAARGTRGKEK